MTKVIFLSKITTQSPQQRYDNYTENHALAGDSEHIIFNNQN